MMWLRGDYGEIDLNNLRAHSWADLRRGRTYLSLAGGCIADTDNKCRNRQKTVIICCQEGEGAFDGGLFIKSRRMHRVLCVDKVLPCQCNGPQWP